MYLLDVAWFKRFLCHNFFSVLRSYRTTHAYNNHLSLCMPTNIEVCDKHEQRSATKIILWQDSPDGELTECCEDWQTSLYLVECACHDCECLSALFTLAWEWLMASPTLAMYDTHLIHFNSVLHLPLLARGQPSAIFLNTDRHSRRVIYMKPNHTSTVFKL